MNNLKKLRKAKKLTQQQVADAVGIGAQAYAYYEKSEREPSQETIFKLADFFDVTLDELLGRSSGQQLFDDARIERPETLEIYESLPASKQEALLNYARGMAVGVQMETQNQNQKKVGA